MISQRYRNPSDGTVLGPSQFLSPVSTVALAATNSAASTSISNYCGKVTCSNAAGLTVPVLTVTINNTNVHPNSVILVSCERANLSATGTEYLVNVSYNSVVDGVSFNVDIVRRAGTSIAASGAENVIVNYMIIN